VEGDLAEMPGGLPPPGAVLGPVAAAASLPLGGEVHHHHAPAVLGDAGRGAEPAVGIGGELSLPAVQLPVDPSRVERPALHDLDEHGLRLPGDAAGERTAP
jgi:hypothetical protein